MLGTEHPHTLISSNNLATTLIALGEFESAAEMQRATLATQQRVLGSEHPDTCATEANLLAMLAEQNAITEPNTVAGAPSPQPRPKSEPDETPVEAEPGPKGPSSQGTPLAKKQKISQSWSLVGTALPSGQTSV